MRHELREDFAQRAIKNVTNFYGEEIGDRYCVNLGDAYEGFSHSNFDRMVLDLPEPWKVVDHIPGTLKSGGVFVAYTPSITQVSKLRQRLETDDFVMLETTEILRGMVKDQNTNQIIPQMIIFKEKYLEKIIIMLLN